MSRERMPFVAFRRVLTFSVALSMSYLYPLGAQPHSRLRPRVSSLITWDTQIVPVVIVGDGWSQSIVLLDVDCWSTFEALEFANSDASKLAFFGAVSPVRRFL
jgi:hypothetical protein